jgi:hypothetical protein
MELRPTRICKKCGTEQSIEAFPTASSKGVAFRRWECRSCIGKRQAVFRNKHKIRLRTYSSNFQKVVRDKIIDAYGAKCACCGEDERLFLCIDHVNNDGKAHRAQFNNCGYAVFKDIINRGFPPEFQVLCHNCNMSKEFHGECPHATKRNVIEISRRAEEEEGTVLDAGDQRSTESAA